MTLTDGARDDIFFALSNSYSRTADSDPHFLLRLTLLLASDVGDRRLVLDRIDQASAATPHPRNQHGES